MVSVVIPAYNVTKTLPRLLECLLNQTWQNLQIILVDDGSEDGTALMAREAAEKDPRLTVVTQGNLGISYARNAGLDLCEGKYIRFIDADDTLPLDSIERMVRRAEKDGSELVIGGYDQYFGERRSFHNLAGRDDTVPCDDMMRHLCDHANSYFYGVLWNKLFLREIVEKLNCRFQENLTWGEDFAFVMDYFSDVKQVSFMKDSLYDYRRSANSTSIKQVLDCVKHPAENTRIKGDLYRHLKDMYRKRGLFEKYKKRLWLYLFRVGLG
jgi:glycosyltransferase involved in cell wall biosynthesis